MCAVTVVIPSLGNADVFQTINILNSGTLIPDNIFLCVPVDTIIRFEIPDNLKIIYCNKRSQVAQRAEGFRLAKTEYVLQLDDDTHLEKTCLEKLVGVLANTRQPCAVVPVILNSETKESIYKVEASITPFKYIRYFIANGRQLYVPGTITKVGSCFGPSFTENSDVIVEIEWAAGCCILHRRSNLLYTDYYPFSGKAYSEDLIASYFYKLKSVVFYAYKNATCYTAPYDPKSSSIFDVYKEIRAKYYYLTLLGRNCTRFYFYAAFRYGNEILINLPKRLFNMSRKKNA